MTTRTGRVRKWLTENPGWHFDDCIQEGLGIPAEERKDLLITLANMYANGAVERRGSQGARRYTLGNPPHASRAYR